MGPDIGELAFFDPREELRDPVHEGLTADISDLWMAAGLVHEMLGAAKTDLHPDRVRTRREERSWILDRARRIKREFRQYGTHELRLMQAELLAFASSIEGAG